MNKFTEKLEKVGNKYRIIETIEVNSNTCKKVNITEEKILCEGKELKTNKVGYRFKIWNSEFNYNGRNYKKVIPLAIKQNLKSISLMNHPTEDVDVRDICGVTKDWKLDSDGWCSVLFIPCGDHGKVISDVIEAEGPISVSSSILGDVDDDGYIVPEEYILERAMDVVWGPSNGLNQYKDKVEFQQEDGTRDLVSEEGCVTETKKITMSNNLKESTVKVGDTDNAVEEKGDNLMEEDKKLAEQIKSSLALNIKSMIKEAKATKDLYEKKQILESANLYAKQLEDDALITSINTELSATENEIKDLSVKGLETEDLKAEIEALKKEVEELKTAKATLETEKADIEEKLNTVTEMFESKQYACSEAEAKKAHNLSKEVCTLKLKARRQESVIHALKTRNAKLTEKLEFSEAKANTMVDADDYAKILEEKETVRKSLRDLRIKHLKEEDSEDRLLALKKKLHKAEDEEAEDQTTTETEEVDEEDLAMEKMLNMSSESTDKETNEEDSFEDDEDTIMERILNGNK